MSVPRLVGLRRGPEEIVLVRHAESVGNVADAEAQSRHRERLDLSARDADVELSERGAEQAEAVGRWLTGLDPSARPTVVLSSPYRRAADTAARAVSGIDLEVVLDERLRERDLGLFDGLTKEGIVAQFPDEAERRKKLGKFYYKPPSGESWADVVLRVRSVLADLREGFEGERVWVFTHQAVIMAFRYVLEGLSESELLDIDHQAAQANASMTRFSRDGDDLALAVFADTSAVDKADTELTREEQQAGRGRGHGA